jgi:sigma-B regulation protein RsbU (phosphoserine phosphatase)
MNELTLDRESSRACATCAGALEAELLAVYPQARICLDCMQEQELRALENDLTVAQEVNASLLPRRLPQDGAWEVGVHYRPSRILSGDFYDFIERPEPATLALAIGDVAGKGIPAGLLRASLQATLRALSQESFAPGAILQRSNRLFLDSSQPGRFASVFYGILDLEGARLIYANGGHNPPLVRRACGTIELLDATGPVVGALRDSRFEEADLHLGPGDLLVLYTDGVTEAADSADRFYGTENLAAALERRAAGSAQEIANHIADDLARFAPGEPADDRTLVVFRGRRAS